MLYYLYMQKQGDYIMTFDENDFVYYDLSDKSNDKIYKIVKTLRENNNQETKIDEYIFKFIDNQLMYKSASENKEYKIEFKEEIKNTRKTIKMLKIINSNNFSHLFDGNFYPIIKHENGYYTIKDDEGNKCLVRENRGKEIEIFIEKPE